MLNTIFVLYGIKITLKSHFCSENICHHLRNDVMEVIS